MTVLLPKSMKSKQEVIQNIFFFSGSTCCFLRNDHYLLLAACCENGMFIWGCKSKKTFDTKIKNAVYLLPAPPNRKIFRDITLFKVFSTLLLF